MTATLRDPLGNQFPSIAEDEVRRIIETAPDEYWTQGSGDLAIKAFKNEAHHTLSIVKKPGIGFMLNIFSGGKQWVAVTSSDYEATTITSVGGEPWEVPAAFFVEPAKAIRAAIHFYREGNPADELMWVDFHEQSWENKLT